MRRREFLKTSVAVGAGSTALSAAPFSSVLMATTETAGDSRAEVDVHLVDHCRRILEQNLLTSGETFILATPDIHDEAYAGAMMAAAGGIGAHGMHVAVINHPERGESHRGRLEKDPRSGLDAVHWDTYAKADLLVTTDLGAPPGYPGPATSYAVKVGDHEYDTDHNYINRPGSRTRWLDLGFPVWMQEEYFPTEELRTRTLDGAKWVHEKTRIHVTSAAGSDWVCTKEGRPGHAQYGIADRRGRWDNYGYGCVAFMPNEESAEGTLVLEPGDIIPDLYPRVIEEEVRLEWSGGYVTEVEGGRTARVFEDLLASYDDPEAFGLSHFGWGTHERTRIGSGSDAEIGHFHHNRIGTLLFAVGINFGHGVGGPETGYSGSGTEADRKAPNHTHFTIRNASVAVDGEQVVRDGELLMR